VALSVEVHPSRAHLAALVGALIALEEQVELIEQWGERLSHVLLGGGRLLAAGNGGSAAQAQHLTAELVGRYRRERPALSAIALHAETSSLTAIANDYGAEDMFARQVRAHGRPGDVLLALSTSGRSRNLTMAAAAARAGGISVWALTGARPNPLATLADECLCIDALAAATVQEAHQVVLHLLCEAVDRRVASVSLGDRPELLGG
jgi:D-sedoheptulose 7-phosphate isomerase